MQLKSKRATVVGLSALVVAACLGGCHSDAPTAAELGKPGYYPGKMAPKGKGRSDDGIRGGGQPGSGAPSSNKGMGG